MCLIWKPAETWYSVYISFISILFYYPIWVKMKGEYEENARNTEICFAFLFTH